MKPSECSLISTQIMYWKVWLLTLKCMQMLGWEQQMLGTIEAVRSMEMRFSGRMSYIRAANMTLQFCSVPLLAFITFSVVRFTYDTLNLRKVIAKTSDLKGSEVASFVRLMYICKPSSTGFQTFYEWRLEATCSSLCR